MNTNRGVSQVCSAPADGKTKMHRRYQCIVSYISTSTSLTKTHAAEQKHCFCLNIWGHCLLSHVYPAVLHSSSHVCFPVCLSFCLASRSLSWSSPTHTEYNSSSFTQIVQSWLWYSLRPLLCCFVCFLVLLVTWVLFRTIQPSICCHILLPPVFPYWIPPPCLDQSLTLSHALLILCRSLPILHLNIHLYPSEKLTLTDFSLLVYAYFGVDLVCHNSRRSSSWLCPY